MLSGLAARNLRAFLPRAAPAIVAALLAFQAAASAWNYFGVYRRDPRVYVWANIVDVEMAQYVRSRAAETGVVLINPDFPSATLKFLAAGDIRAGRIAFRPARHPGLVFVTQFREPVSQQPLLFVFHAPELEGTGAAALLILNPAGVLGPASNEAAAGRWEAAAGRYREALDMFPDLALGHLRYAQVLERLGSRREAAAERLTARRLGLDREP
jgi:tetratricopeptide (TPR) repeat protein